MKYLLIASLLGLFCYTTQAQVAPIDNFYAKHKRGSEVVSLNLPGFVLRLGASIAQFGAEDDMERAALALLKDVRKAKILAGDGLKIEQAEVRKLVRALEREGFEELMTIRSDEATVDIIIREKKDVIRNLFLIVNEDEETVMISLKTHLYLEDLAYIINESAKM